MSNIDRDNTDLFEDAEGSLSQSQIEDGDFEEDILTFNLAGLNSRAVAFFIDLIIISLVALLAFGIGIFFVKDAGDIVLDRVFMPIYLLLFFLGSSYFVVLNGYGGKTIGKMIMGIRIISTEGSNIGFWQSFARWIGYYISGAFLFIGFLWSIFDKNSQSWHDKIAGTYVVRD